MIAQSSRRWLPWLHTIALIIALFTGFGNMPLWGRYYIADIPGLKWSGEFFVNLQIHLFVGALMFGLAVYVLVYHTTLRTGGVRITTSGTIRAVLLALTLLSGIVLAVRNLPGILLPFELQVGLVFSHMGAAVAFTVASIICFFARCRWTKQS